MQACRPASISYNLPSHSSYPLPPREVDTLFAFIMSNITVMIKIYILFVVSCSYVHLNRLGRVGGYRHTKIVKGRFKADLRIPTTSM